MSGFIIFDDDRGGFGPLTDLRPVYRLRTGSQMTSQRIVRRLGRTILARWAPGRLVDVLRERVNEPVNALPEGDAFLCVNGRWTGLDELTVPEPGQALLEDERGDVVMAHLAAGDAATFLESGSLPPGTGTTETRASMYVHPWDILDRLETALVDDLASSEVPKMSGDELLVHGKHDVHLHRGATIFPGVVADTSAGPVVIEDGVVVRCNAVLCGPCFIGAGSVISDGAVIKARTSIGPGCRIGGEVGSTIFQGHSNKAHEGHLGDSLVGSWVNLGAGTTNSNLLNTYSEVIVRLKADDQSRRSGRIFMGSIIGDHVRTAILTRLMTGTVLGTGSMIASTASPPTTVPPFTWLTDRGAGAYRIEKFLDVARTVMARRDHEPGSAEEAALRSLAEHARITREQA